MHIHDGIVTKAKRSTLEIMKIDTKKGKLICIEETE